MTTTRRAAGLKSCKVNQRQRVWKYLNRPEGDSREVTTALMQTVWSSAAALAMAPLQDVLNLGSEARMNVPGRAGGNWRWRCNEEMLSAPAFEQLRDLIEGDEPMEVTR